MLDSEARQRRFDLRLVLVALAALAGCARSPLLAPEPLRACVPVDPDRPSTQIISATVDIDRSDVLFLVDTSNSMAEEIEGIRAQLVEVLIPGIHARVSDARFGVAAFSDFGAHRVGVPAHPYQLLLPITDRVSDVLAAVEGIELEHGGDKPESQLEALYQVATGEGLAAHIDPGPPCRDGARAGVCFRDGAFAIVMLFSDAPMRNVVGIDERGEPAPLTNDAAFAPAIPYVREYDETIEALQASSIRVVGLWSGERDGIDDMRRVARDTGAFDGEGQPIVLDIGTAGEGLGRSVIGSIERLTAGARHDVRLELADGNPLDGTDPRDFVTAVRAVRAAPAGGGTPDEDRFIGVRPGVTVFFELTFDASSLPRSEQPQRYPLAVSALASDGTRLSHEIVDLVVAPPETACAAGE